MSASYPGAQTWSPAGSGVHAAYGSAAGQRARWRAVLAGAVEEVGRRAGPGRPSRHTSDTVTRVSGPGAPPARPSPPPRRPSPRAAPPHPPRTAPGARPTPRARSRPSPPSAGRRPRAGRPGGRAARHARRADETLLASSSACGQRLVRPGGRAASSCGRPALGSASGPAAGGTRRPARSRPGPCGPGRAPRAGGRVGHLEAHLGRSLRNSPIRPTSGCTAHDVLDTIRRPRRRPRRRRGRRSRPARRSGRPGGPARQRLPGRRQPHAPAVPLEKAEAELVLEGAHSGWTARAGRCAAPARPW